MVPIADEVEIPAAQPVPSAIDSDPGADAAADGRVRGKPFVRPQLGLALRDGDAAARLGAVVGHAWWTLGERTVQLGGETALRATAPIGGASGWRVDLGTRAGPWLGPVSLWIGPALRADAERWSAGTLSPALLVGGTADLGLDLGNLGLVAGVEPLVGVAGDRVGETDWRAGVRGDVGPVELLGEATLRDTEIGAIVEVGVGFRLRFR